MRVIYCTLYANFYGNSMTEFCVNLIRDLSEISRGGGGWKRREGYNFLRLQKREGS